MRAVVYTQPNCQPCKAVKRHLTRLNAEWSEIPISDDIRAVFRLSGFLTAPVVEIIDDAWDMTVDTFAGYRPDKIDEYFKER